MTIFFEIIRNKIKNKYLFLVLFFLLVGARFVFAQMPSFEIYHPWGHAEPDIINPNVTKISDIFVSITATISDISGISSAGAIIRDYYSGLQIEIAVMYDDGSHLDDSAGDSIYGALISIENYYAGTYYIDIFAVDNLGNRTDLFYVGTFSKSISTQINPFTVNPSSTTPGGTVTLFAALTANDGTPIDSELISFRDETDDVDIGSAYTDWYGGAEISYIVSSTTTNASHNLKAIYNGNPDRNLSDSYQTTILSVVLPISTQINPFIVNPPSVVAGNSVALSATLKKNDGTPINGESISFQDETSSINIGSATTNSSGVAEIPYAVSLIAATGNHTLKASYSGNVSKNFLSSYSETTLTVTSAGGTCTTVNNATICINIPPTNSDQISSFSSNPGTIVAGNTVTLTANLSGAVGELIHFRDLAFPYIIGSAVTDVNGTATITYYVSPGTTLGSHTLTAMYNGNLSRDYLPSYKNTTLNVTSPGTCTTVNNATICINVSTSTSAP